MRPSVPIGRETDAQELSDAIKEAGYSLIAVGAALVPAKGAGRALLRLIVGS